MEKSYVTMGLFPICGKENGTILMDRRIKDTFGKQTIDPTNPCDKCKEKYLKNGVMLFCFESGDLVVLKDEAFKGMFERELPPKKIAFCEQGVIDKINQQTK
jgi:hypothetical protein